MKKIGITYLFLFIFSICFSQEWHHSTWHWVNGTSSFKTAVEGDTILPSMESGKKLIAEGREIEVVQFEKDTLVYLHDGEKFDTLYYFSAAVGKSWTIKPKAFSEDILITVIKRGNMNINSYTLDYQVVDYKLVSEGESYTDTVVQVLGNMNNYYIPIEGMILQLIDYPITELNCYKNDSISYNRFNRDCNYNDGGLSLEESIVKNKSSILFPNPVVKNQTIMFSDEIMKSEIRTISVFNLIGECIGNRNTDLKLQIQESGTYYVIVELKNGTFINEKVIVK